VLAQLDRAADGLTMGALSGRLMVSAGNVTGLVNRLAEEGLVETARLPEDRRTQVVRLTEAGKTAFDRMTPAHESWIDSMLSALTPGEAEALYGLLGKVRTGLQQETAR
jgi:DNA-binding MarR family transcriptional regulator